MMTGVRPFDDVENLSDINRLVSKGERPRLFEFNAEPAYPSMEELMYDCWKQLANDRPTAKQVGTVICVIYRAKRGVHIPYSSIFSQTEIFPILRIKDIYYITFMD